jgi:hypothetical protein
MNSSEGRGWRGRFGKSSQKSRIAAMRSQRCSCRSQKEPGEGHGRDPQQHRPRKDLTVTGG